MLRRAFNLSCLVLLIASPAGAQLIRVTATGTIQSVNPLLEGQFSAGQSATLVYEFDPGVPDFSGNPTFGTYNAIATQSGTLGTYIATFTATSFFGVINVADNGGIGPTDDSYTAFNPSNDPPVGDPIGEFMPTSMGITLRDTSETAFSSDTLPTNLDLSDFDSASMTLSFSDGTLNPTVTASIESLVFAPEPRSAFLPAVAGALLAIAGVRRDRSRRSGSYLTRPTVSAIRSLPKKGTLWTSRISGRSGSWWAASPR